jgi:hypothetical protein
LTPPTSKRRLWLLSCTALLIAASPCVIGGVAGLGGYFWFTETHPPSTPTPLPPIVAGLPPAMGVEQFGKWAFRSNFRSSEFRTDGTALVVRNVGFALSTDDVILIFGRDFIDTAKLVFAMPDVTAYQLRGLGQQKLADGTITDVTDIELRVRRATATGPAWVEAGWQTLRQTLTGPGDSEQIGDTLRRAWERSQQ